MLVHGLGDRGVRDAAYAGLLAARRRTGVHVVLLEPRTVAEYQPDLMAFATGGSQLSIAVGYSMAADVSEVAGRYPGAQFAVIDADVDEPNVTSVTFRSEEAAFLGGALAALASKTKRIAFVGGLDEPEVRRLESGFIAGVRQADPAVEVVVWFVGSFVDVTAAKELAAKLYAGDADIIFAAAGSANAGIIDAARRRRGAYVIDVATDADASAPGIVLTSVAKHADVSIERLCELVVEHQLPHRLSLGLKEGGVGLTGFPYSRAVVSAPIRSQIAALQAALAAGAIVAPHDLAGAANYVRVILR